ncbi:hypothetical protein TNIN_475601 [Trichonephila inaurata madagascariensis]|uniref:Uncharacterized protein n=1 Tax=Trichonephila inaurata madagascariensis TaxID=2747483 RepID=A0A8X6YMA2_9ARAC|nr:hypothetical protein TNIN_475601 [Trichonephila inaurata madagascariensis]
MPPWGEPCSQRAAPIGGSVRFPRVHWLRGSRARGRLTTVLFNDHKVGLDFRITQSQTKSECQGFRRPQDTVIPYRISCGRPVLHSSFVRAQGHAEVTELPFV